ncbi:MAG: ribonuclease R [Balneolales bacterium]|nr:ribonuclease R [Balneolales bacterium]
MGKKKKVKELEAFMLGFLRKNTEYEVPEELLLKTAQHTGGQVKALKRALDGLIDSGAVIRNNKGELSLAKGGTVEAARAEGQVGKISINRHGTGFVTLEGHDEDIRIPGKKLSVALDRDIVRIRLQGTDRMGRTEGKVLDIVERGKKYYVGTLKRENKNAWLIEPDEKSAHTEFYVQPGNISGGQSGDKVIFKLLDWVHPRSLPEAIVTEVLGAKGTNRAEVLSILAENDMISSFTPEVEEWCEQIPLFPGEEEIARRRDIRDMLVFTIDPEDAKDFDDALSISELENGNYYLGVHIADVSYYVHPKTILDDAAHERATSVYLVDRVIPMLPEKLSNGVCSLRPNEDKMTYSCFMEVSPAGEVLGYSIEETVIHSKYRLTYEQAQEIIEGKAHAELSEPMEMLVKLTDRLTEKRFEENAIDFETPEPRFVLDEKGTPVDVIIKKSFKAHRLIEECMLLANRSVAEHVDALRARTGKKITQDTFPFFYRIHPEPDTERLEQVAEHVRPVGIKFDVRKGQVDAKTINNVLKQVKGKSIEFTVNDLMLRSMAKAEYSPKNIGHFGLGFSHYAHFTSPIRRYPDVLVHRLLKSYSAGLPSYNFKSLLTYGEHCSERERAAVTAERDSIKLKQVEYLSTRIGQEFDGVVSGVTERGVYVLLKDIYCEGMVSMSELSDDYYVFDKRRHCLTGRRKGRTYMLGNELKVRVVNTNLELRQIDFELA